jgi:hypothetical protein
MSKDYTILTQQADVPGQVEAGHNAITFINRGTSNAIVNGIELIPNDFLTIGGNFDEKDKTKWQYTFAGAGNNKLIIVRKIYGK